jgi:predicted ATP-grasp superfamily ATP-dependent carboligase
MKALILSFSFKPSYHVLRLAQDAGYSVYVLGRDCGKGLGHSRFCSGFQNMEFDPRTQSLDVGLKEISQAITRVGADVILPSDIVSTRILASLADRLPVPVYPVPSPAAFDVMNDKWEFYHFCKKHNISVPETMLFDDMASLRKALVQGVMPYPVIVKPHDAQGSFGMHILHSANDLPVLANTECKPVLLQKFVEGDWYCIDILADHGRIVAHAIRLNYPDRRAFVKHEKLLAATARIIEACGYNGAACFDAMQDGKTGELSFLECNPRFWYSIFATAHAGLNFVKAGLAMKTLDPAQPLSIAGVDVPKFKTAIKKKLKLSRMNEIDRLTFGYLIADPACAFCHILPMFDDNRGTGPGSTRGQSVSLAALRAQTR